MKLCCLCVRDTLGLSKKRPFSHPRTSAHPQHTPPPFNPSFVKTGELCFTHPLKTFSMLKTLEKLGVTKQQIYGKNRGMKNYKTISTLY